MVLVVGVVVVCTVVVGTVVDVVMEWWSDGSGGSGVECGTGNNDHGDCDISSRRCGFSSFNGAGGDCSVILEIKNNENAIILPNKKNVFKGTVAREKLFN